MTDDYSGIDFNLPTSKCIIKVIGVGGGGGNAVNHMYREGIHDVSFALCNTDKQALSKAPVPVRLQLGAEGLGAGNKPARAREAAEESINEITNLLNDGTKMVFITAGMGGGTGTGAAPIIAQVAKKMGILTVGIVTIPFLFEGNKKIDQALDGVEEISKHVDALLVINNERLRKIYPDLSVLNAFGKADDTLSIAAKSIAEIITTEGTINLDFNDVKMALKDGGVAIISTGFGEGENRVTKAIQNALHSPLLNNNDLFRSKKVLLNIAFCNEKEEDGLMMEEMNEVNDFMSQFGEDVEVKWGLCVDPTLGKRVKITILTTGFGLDCIPGMEERIQTKSQDSEDRLAELNIRRGEFYGNQDGPRISTRRHHIFLFNTNDLNNDDIISMIDTTPTFKRTKELLESIKSKSRTYEESLNLNNNPESEPNHYSITNHNNESI